MKNKKIYLLKIFLFLFLIVSHFSFSGDYTDKLNARMKKFENSINFGSTNADLSNAGQKLYNEWDKELNTIYRKIIAILDREKLTGAKNNLISAQKGWIQYRDNESKFKVFIITDGGKGTIRTQIAYMTLIDIVSKRTVELAETYDTLTEFYGRERK